MTGKRIEWSAPTGAAADLTADGSAEGSVGRVLQWVAGRRGDADPSRGWDDIVRWLRQRTASNETDGESPEQRFVRLIDVLISHLDRRLAEFLDAILHHPDFQRLEAAWRGVEYLVNEASEARTWLEQDGEQLKEIRVRILALTKEELQRDLLNALEVDQSSLWKAIYEQEFGTAGGTPFGVLIGDYAFAQQPRDLDTLECLAQMGAAAFCPFLSAVNPSLLGVDDFPSLPLKLQTRYFQGADFAGWHSLRGHPDSRFLGLVMPRILMRAPYRQRDGLLTQFPYEEAARCPEGERYLWGNAAFAMGGVLLRAFAECGWFADIRGARRGQLGGGLVTGLPGVECGTDASRVIMKAPVDVMLSEEQEAVLASLGIIPLRADASSPWGIFFVNPSLHEPPATTDVDKMQNEKLSSMLQYVLCTARFAHCIKRLGRQWIGRATTPYELSTYINDWLIKYVVPTEDADPYFKARHPLRAAHVEVTEAVENPGEYRLVIRLQPHYQLEGAQVRLETRIVSEDAN